MRLTLLSRAYCHLCDEMRQALEPLLAAHAVALDVIDVDARDELDERWGDKVPVLLAGTRELCRYRLDRSAVTAWLAGVCG